MRDLHARLARAERQAGVGNPVFLVRFADGSSRVMLDIDLILYCIKRSAYLAEPDSDITDLPAFTDYRLIRGDRDAMSDWMMDEIEDMKGK